MKRVRLKRTVKSKLILFLILSVIMSALIIGEALVYNKQPADIPVESEPQTTETEATTDEETTAESTAPEETASETTAAPTVTAPTASTAKPVMIDPTSGRWELTLVNLSHILPEQYVPSLSASVSGSTVKMDSRAAAEYQKMYDAAKKEDCVLTPYSGYVSISRQNDNYTRKVNYFVSQGLSEAEAKSRASAIVLPGGCSEHNLGLSMDIVSASTDFASTKEFKWLVNNAVNYGFILRYPENKVEKTGVNYQPWHWRYVGVAAAKAMAESGQCLEEYLGA